MKRIKKVVIVGGDESAWLSAAGLAKLLKDSEVELVVVSAVGATPRNTVESATPYFIDYLDFLEIDRAEFIASTDAAYGLATRFDCWSSASSSYYQAYESTRGTVSGLSCRSENELFELWLQSDTEDKNNASGYSWFDYCAVPAMCQHDKFLCHQADEVSSIFGAVDYGLSVETHKLIHYFKGYARGLGAELIEDRLSEVMTGAQGVSCLKLASGRLIEADLFIDCSGTAGVLISEALAVPLESWQRVLPCDRSVSVTTVAGDELPPYRLVEAVESGWLWRANAQLRASKGLVYSSEHWSDERALDVFLMALQKEDASVLASGLHTEPHVIQSISGMRQSMWQQNCVALGAAAGCIEPLEPLNIQCIVKSLMTLFELLSPASDVGSMRTDFNRVMRREYEHIRDFTVLHYHCAKRDDTDFWRRCMDLQLSDALSQQIVAYHEQRCLDTDRFASFDKSSWRNLFVGSGILPNNAHIDETPHSARMCALSDRRQEMRSAVSALSSQRRCIEERDAHRL